MLESSAFNVDLIGKTKFLVISFIAIIIIIIDVFTTRKFEGFFEVLINGLSKGNKYLYVRFSTSLLIDIMNTNTF